MKRLTATLCLTIAVLLGSVGAGYALPPCPVSKPMYQWDNCYGTDVWPGGKIKYVGEFRNGKRNGQGTFTWADGSKYVGEFRDYKMHGLGTATYANGNKYVGEWKYGKFHGRGTHTSTDGRIKEGIWKDGWFQFAEKVTPPVVARKPMSVSSEVSPGLLRGVQAWMKGDYKTAMREYLPLAEQGVAEAQFQIGWMYSEGQGVPQDHKTALDWYERAAVQGQEFYRTTRLQWSFSGFLL